MTGWAGPAPRPEEPRLGVLDSLTVVLLRWPGPDAGPADGPCVVTEPEAQ